MENWENLNIVLTLEKKECDRKEHLSKMLIEFCLKEDKEEIKKLLKDGANLNSHDEHLTPLICCIQNDNIELATYMLSSGASISYRPHINFQDALWYSLKNKKYGFLRLFVENRCVLLREQEKNLTPLIFATIGSDAVAVAILLSHGNIKVNERDRLGNTALHYNVSKNPMSEDDVEIGKLLLAAGADTATTNFDGKIPSDLAEDFAAKTILEHDLLNKSLPEKEENQEQLQELKEGITLTKSKKMKI